MRAFLVIFDIDGTLCDTFDVDDECFCAAASRVLKIPIVLTSWEGATHIIDAAVTDWLWRKYLHRSPTADEIQGLANVYESTLVSALRSAPHRFSVIRGALKLIDRLIRVGVEHSDRHWWLESVGSSEIRSCTSSDGVAPCQFR